MKLSTDRWNEKFVQKVCWKTKIEMFKMSKSFQISKNCHFCVHFDVDRYCAIYLSAAVSISMLPVRANVNHFLDVMRGKKKFCAFSTLKYCFVDKSSIGNWNRTRRKRRRRVAVFFCHRFCVLGFCGKWRWKRSWWASFVIVCRKIDSIGIEQYFWKIRQYFGELRLNFEEVTAFVQFWQSVWVLTAFL